MAARAASGEQDRRASLKPPAPRQPCLYGSQFAFGSLGALRGRRPAIGRLPRQPEDKAHGQRHGEQRGAAIGDEGQRHALGGEQADIHRHVDQGLQAEQHDQPGGRVANEAVRLLRCLGQAAQHDEGKQQRAR